MAVLLRGESGTGKGVLARLLHAREPARASGPSWSSTARRSRRSCWRASCSVTRGARSPARCAIRPGRVEAADGGTLFLDEIGEISPGLQAKLLRFLQEKQFERVGENRTRSADVRVVAATNRDLDAEVQAGRFREDLLYRLNVVEIAVPPLRERPEDILPLARRFLAFFARRPGDRRRSCRPRRSACSPATRGRATSASCATPSSAR